MASKKERLDVLVFERGLAESRAKAQSQIMAGQVMVNGQRVDKAGAKFAIDVAITVKQKPRFVSRGGEKLAWALKMFDVRLENSVAADVGASTGGFTDCLLQHGVSRVYAIDVGYGQLAHKLRIDDRVVIMERTNARYLEKLPEIVDLVVIDASFISLRLLIPRVKQWLADHGNVIALVKPQFEAGKSDVSRGGIVRDSLVHRRVIRETVDSAIAAGFTACGLTTSPIRGLKEGNTEFLVWLRNGPGCNAFDLDSALTSLE